MPAQIKAVVFKTAQLKTSRLFFENVLNFQIQESSARHFVIYSKGIRLVFVASPDDFEVEIYIKGKLKNPLKELLPDIAVPGLESYKAPNGIRIVIIGQKFKTEKSPLHTSIKTDHS